MQVRFATEWLPGGGCINNFALNTFRLYHYTGSTGTFMMLAQVVFMCHLLHKIYHTIRYGFVKLGVMVSFFVLQIFKDFNTKGNAHQRMAPVRCNFSCA